MTVYLRRALVFKTGLFLLVCATVVAQAAAAIAHIDIPAQLLADSLRAVGSQANVNVLFDPPLVGARQALALRGDLTADEALTTLLTGTGIAHEFLNERTIVLAAVSASPADNASARGPRSVTSALQADQTRELAHAEGAAPHGSNAATASLSVWQRFKLARAQSAAQPEAPSAQGPNAAAKQTVVLSEVVVTAQKRSERLLDVPVPVSALSASQLRDGNRLQLADYYAQVPGLSFAGDPVGGSAAVSIRGLSSGVSYNINPAVGFTIDDVPYGSARADGGSYALPEIDPGDLERMEVLRGPQGTLYGASSLGGLIKYVTVEPSFDALAGQVSVGMNGIENGDGPGYKTYGSINAPLSDTLALRASGFARTTPGYIENPLRGTDGIGDVRARGGRLVTLWEPREALSVKLSAFYQDIEQNGALRFANPTSPYDAGRGLAGVLGYLQQNDLPGTGVRKTENRGFNATLRGRFGQAQLVSITGYNSTNLRNLTDDWRDFEFATAATAATFGPAVPNNSTAHTFDGIHELKKFAQELRVSVPLGTRVEALFGAFYTDEDYTGTFTSRFVQPTTAQEIAIRDIGEVAFSYQEWAGFANLTVRIAEPFDVQLGARRGHNQGRYDSLNRGPQIGGVALGAPLVGPTFASSEYVSTYLLTPRYRFNDNLMLYARYSTGYRPGGFNSRNDFNVPYPPYRSDTSKNYELGFKGALLDGALTLDASVYRIDWDHIQVQVLPPGSFFPLTENGGMARSQGVELSLTMRPWHGLELSGWIALNEAQLAEDFPATATAAGRKGDRLPISSKVSGSLSLTQEFALANGLTSFVGGTFTYVGDRLGNFTGPNFFTGIVPPRDRFASYDTVDLRAGVRNERWTVALYVANAADERGIIYGDRDYLVPIKPREFGVNATRSF